MSTTFTFKSFEQWKRDNPDILELEEDCEECDGTGEHECDCGSSHECGFCDGTGKLTKVTLEKMYRDQNSRDKKRLEKWMAVSS